jgi:ribosomal protein L11 methyltransferase
VQRVSFRIPADSREDVLDGVLPMLPSGIVERHVGEGVTELASFGAALPSEQALRAASPVELDALAFEDVPADWRERRRRFGGGAVVIAGRLMVRSPDDPPAPEGVPELVIGGGGFGSGSHPTTQMCLALLLELEVAGGVADLGCGVGTLAIAAAKLGWGPVVAVDRVPIAIEVARENVERNSVVVACDVADLAVDPVPLAPLLLVNAPPPVHARVVEAMDGSVRHVIVSGIVAEEVEAVVAGYRSVGFDVVNALGTEDEWIALRFSC